MGKVYSLTDKRHAYQPPPCVIHFTRSELNQLLSLYSRRVAGGEWRDYAIDQRAGQAAFSVFRHTHDRPLYTITKRRAHSGQSVEYLVFRDYCRLVQAARLDDALNVLKRRLRIVS
jgi:hypothetical protein